MNLLRAVWFCDFTLLSIAFWDPVGLRPGSHSVCVQMLYTQFKARLPTGCGWSQTYQQDEAEYLVDATNSQYKILIDPYSLNSE